MRHQNPSHHESQQEKHPHRDEALRHHHLCALHHVLGLDSLPHPEPSDGWRRERHRSLDLLGHQRRYLHRYLRIRHQRHSLIDCPEGYRRGLRHQDGVFHHHGIGVHVALAALHHRPDDGRHHAALCQRPFPGSHPWRWLGGLEHRRSLYPGRQHRRHRHHCHDCLQIPQHLAGTRHPALRHHHHRLRFHRGQHHRGLHLQLCGNGGVQLLH